MNSDAQFEAVLAAYARHNHRPRLTPEQIEAEKREAHRNDPRHRKALARRKKRKRGGPK